MAIELVGFLYRDEHGQFEVMGGPTVVIGVNPRWALTLKDGQHTFECVVETIDRSISAAADAGRKLMLKEYGIG